MKLYFTYLRLHIKRQVHYRLSFLFITFGQFCFTSTSLFMIYFLMENTPELFGFTRNEVLIAGAIINLSYALSECFARGFDQFGSLIKTGDFDRLIVRPVNEVTQVFMNTIDFTRLGRFSVALVTLIIVAYPYPWTTWLYFLFLVLTGAMLYTCIFILIGAVCFYTTENLEVFNILTDGSKEFGKVPYGFYGESLLKFLTFVFPLALVQYYPLLAILNKVDQPFYLWTPVMAYLFMIPTAFAWTVARRHYQSSGN